jgi:Rieske 2Fe-2S family protein
VCPYHQWTYAPDGRLLRAKGMEQEGFRTEDFGLVRAKAEEVDGLVWISLADNPPPFEEARPIISNEVGYERTQQRGTTRTNLKE